MAQRDATGEQPNAQAAPAEPGERADAAQYEPPRAFDLGPLVDLTLGGIITGVPGTAKAGS